MRLARILGAVLLGLALLAAPAQAQGKMHDMGDARMSRDGKLIAFLLQGMQRNTFVVVEIDSGRSTRIDLPPMHDEVRDLAWAQTSNTLMFVSAAPAAFGAELPAPSIASGAGTHIWSIAFDAYGQPGPAAVIVRGKSVRRPALSPDGTKVAYFHPVPVPGQEATSLIAPLSAYAVFERDIAGGEPARVSESQYKTPRELFYDGADAWLFSADEPAYVTRMSGSVFWSSTRPGAPPGKGTFDQLTSGIKSFRMARGEVLPDYPDFKQPWPAMGVAPMKSHLVGVMGDGRPILFGAPGPENTAANQQRNMMSWYVDGVSRVDMRYGYVAIGPQGKRQVYFMPGFADGYDGNVGGMGVDGALKRYFRIDIKTGDRTPETIHAKSRLFVYEGETLILGRDVSDILASAATVQIAD